MNKKVGIVFLDDADDYYILQKIIMLNKENYDYVFFTYLLIRTLLINSFQMHLVQREVNYRNFIITNPLVECLVVRNVLK